MKLVRGLWGTFLVLLLVGAADAQTIQVPRVEVGGEGGLLGAIGEGVHFRPMAGPRLTLNITQRDAVELAADTIFLAGSGTYGLYFLQYKRTAGLPAGGGRIRPFYTAGTGGHYNYRRVPERRQSRPDGAVIVYPAHSTGAVTRFTTATFGGGFERTLNRHASFRLEGGGFLALHEEGFVGFRLLLGMSVPVGSYRANTAR